MNSYMQELFNPSVTTEAESTEKTRDLFFNPNANATADKKYQAIVRFIPWYEDPKQSIVKKESAWLTNDVTNESRMVDSPSSVGERCPIKDMFFTLWKSPHEADKAIAKKKFSVRKSYYSLIQVVEDRVNPSNNGKIMIWRYGMIVYDKINQEMNGEFVQRNPFSVMDGRYFHVNVKVEGGFNNYNSCAFVDIPTLPKELQYYNAEGEVIGKADPADQEALLNYLKTGPSLKDCLYRPWDESTRAFVDGVIRAFNDPVNYTKTINAQYAQTAPNPQYQNQSITGMQQPVQQAPQVQNSPVQSNPTQSSAQSNPTQQDEVLTNVLNDINEGNDTSDTGAGSEDLDGLNFDDILNSQMF